MLVVQCNIAILGYTTVPQLTEARAKPFQLQLCPWFVKYGMTINYPTSNDLPITLLQRGRIKLVPLFARYYAPIDVLSLSDKLILHEVCFEELSSKHD